MKLCISIFFVVHFLVFCEMNGANVIFTFTFLLGALTILLFANSRTSPFYLWTATNEGSTYSFSSLGGVNKRPLTFSLATPNHVPSPRIAPPIHAHPRKVSLFFFFDLESEEASRALTIAFSLGMALLLLVEIGIQDRKKTVAMEDRLCVLKNDDSSAVRIAPLLLEEVPCPSSGTNFLLSAPPDKEIRLIPKELELVPAEKPTSTPQHEWNEKTEQQDSTVHVFSLLDPESAELQRRLVANSTANLILKYHKTLSKQRRREKKERIKREKEMEQLRENIACAKRRQLRSLVVLVVAAHLLVSLVQILRVGSSAQWQPMCLLPAFQGVWILPGWNEGCCLSLPGRQQIVLGLWVALACLRWFKVSPLLQAVVFCVAFFVSNLTFVLAVVFQIGSCSALVCAVACWKSQLVFKRFALAALATLAVSFFAAMYVQSYSSLFLLFVYRLCTS